MLVTKAHFAKTAGLTRQAMTPMTKKSGALFKALCKSKIDTESEAAKDFLRKRDIDPSTAFAQVIDGTKPRKPPTFKNKKPVDIEPEELENMTLAQVVDLFGTDQDFEKWTRARKTLTDIRKNDLANAKEEGQLVSRNLIKTGIIEPIDAAHTKMLSDGARTLTATIIELFRAEKDLAEIEKEASKIIGSFIVPVKSKVERVMRNV